MKLHEVHSGISAEKAWALLDNLGDFLNFRPVKHTKFGETIDIDMVAVTHDVLSLIGTGWINEDGTLDRDALRGAVHIEFELANMRNLYGSQNDEIGRTIDAYDKAVADGYSAVDFIKESIAHLRAVKETQKKVENHLYAVQYLSDYISNLPGMLHPNAKQDDHEKSVIKAVLKQIGAFK